MTSDLPQWFQAGGVIALAMFVAWEQRAIRKAMELMAQAIAFQAGFKKRPRTSPPVDRDPE